MTLLAARGLSKEFCSAGQVVRALSGVSLEIARGQLVVVTGESGSGKSTLLGLLGAMDVPTSGTIDLLGEDLGSATPARLARLRLQRLGFVFQDFRLVPHLSALDNIRLPLLLAGARADRETVMNLLECVNMSARASHLPHALSRGEKQRVALARALANRPALLLADEPTASLGRRDSEAVWDLLRGLNRGNGLTVLVATHNPELAGAADQVLHLDDGQLTPPRERT